jgi:hypothetical protein
MVADTPDVRVDAPRPPPPQVSPLLLLNEFEWERVIRGDGGDIGTWRVVGESGGNSSVDCHTSGDMGPLERIEVVEVEDIVLVRIGGGGGGGEVCWGGSG